MISRSGVIRSTITWRAVAALPDGETLDVPETIYYLVVDVATHG